MRAVVDFDDDAAVGRQRRDVREVVSERELSVAIEGDGTVPRRDTDRHDILIAFVTVRGGTACIRPAAAAERVGRDNRYCRAARCGTLRTRRGNARNGIDGARGCRGGGLRYARRGSGQRHDHHDRRNPGRHGRTGGERVARAARIEYVEQPGRQLRGASHRDARQRGRTCRAQPARDVEQMRGIDRRRGAGAQHVIVAGALALLAEPRRRQPHERVEPVHRAGDPRDQLNQEVMPFHVRELVQQHIAAPLGRPGIGFGRQQDGGATHPPRHRHRRPICL